MCAARGSAHFLPPMKDWRAAKARGGNRHYGARYPTRFTRLWDGSDFSTYVRSFLLELKKSMYAFTEDEETELADPGWCGVHLGPQKAVFLRAAPGSSRPNTTYWRVTYRVGHTDYWVNSGWLDKYKHRFDIWAQALAQRAGFTFEPYAIP